MEKAVSDLDGRIKAFVLYGMVNGDVTTWTWGGFREQLKLTGVSPKAYVAQMSIVDPTTYLSRNRDAAFLFMWGKEGDYATPSLQKRFVAAAGPHAGVYMHSGGHGICPDGRKALEAWIVKNLCDRCADASAQVRGSSPWFDACAPS
jgi:hypothetical protein